MQTCWTWQMNELIAVRMVVPDTYLVLEAHDCDIPAGQTRTDVSVTVHKYVFGWVCQSCKPHDRGGDCRHIKAAQREEARRAEN